MLTNIERENVQVLPLSVFRAELSVFASKDVKPHQLLSGSVLFFMINFIGFRFWFGILPLRVEQFQIGFYVSLWPLQSLGQFFFCSCLGFFLDLGLRFWDSFFPNYFNFEFVFKDCFFVGESVQVRGSGLRFGSSLVSTVLFVVQFKFVCVVQCLLVFLQLRICFSSFFSFWFGFNILEPELNNEPNPTRCPNLNSTLYSNLNINQTKRQPTSETKPEI